MSTDVSFGKIRSFLWPVHGHEAKKFIPMFLMLFLICFNYGILRIMKDSVVITASGAEVLPFIKVWGMLPMAILLTFVFTKLSDRYSQERVFYLMTTGFLSFFALFAFILYPMREVFHLHQTADFLEGVLPAGFKGMISMLRYWIFTGFYILSELWSTVVMQILFWGFANEVTRIHEARRFYGTFGIGSNFAAIASGQAGVFFSQGNTYNPSLPFGHDAWEQTMMLLMLVIIGSGLLTMWIFRWMNKKVLTDSSFDDLHATKKAIKAKGRLSLKESFSYLSNSKYLLCIAVLVVSYNLVINLAEIVWKDKLFQLYPSPSDFNTYTSKLHSIMGVVSTITAFFMVSIIGKFGWTKTALITPVTMLITAAGFFGFLFFQETFLDVFISWIGMTPLAIAVFFGSMQNCLSKAAKYSVFDTTKEMAFIPLSHESKLRGKAAIDGVGSRLGKSGGSLIHQGLLMFLTTVSACLPYLAVIFVVIIFLWIIAAKSLGSQFNELAAVKEKAEEKTVFANNTQKDEALQADPVGA
ncbi:MAG TPA: Npt1/Npt2 family nucleotide transporter [Parachlamydiaceae bacterium]|nr:Npt1/Npt2 family nucleotide transporter [Parachlamydiaceae bacterium]